MTNITFAALLLTGDVFLVYHVFKKKLPRICLLYAAAVAGITVAALACDQPVLFGYTAPFWALASIAREKAKNSEMPESKVGTDKQVGKCEEDKI